ncbi:hypothetical protein [Zavarzinella formosa]|uniref:hypothetical protein n=1 Tax=Zavarzinella formosa TaxID=360055 RepID=UPI0002DB09F4|nr:hypothetical protein [Zavarzinella formosa]
MRWIWGVIGTALLAATTMAAEFKAGAFAQDVTPKKFPISVNGNFSDVQATAAHDPLHARCLVLDDGTKKLALVIVDSCMIPRELVLDAKTQAEKLTGIPPENILIAATHTHYAPTLGGVFQSEPSEEYVKFLATKIAEGIKTAHDRREPAKLGFGRSSDPTQVYNRRWKREQALIPPDPFGNTTDQVQMNPGHQAKGLLTNAGPVDPEICMVAVQTAKGEPLALFATYSLHYVGGFPALSADYFGAFAERIKQLVAPENKEFVGAMFNGTSGDVNNINFDAPPAKAGPGERIRIVSESVAKNTETGYRKIEYNAAPTLDSKIKELMLKVRKPAAKDVADAKETLKDWDGKKNLVGSKNVYARETIKLVDFPDEVPVTVQVMRIGDIAITSMPCEIFTEIGLDIKKTSPFKKTFTVCLANGYNGYLPTPEQHALGGYETWRARSSYLEVQASVKMTAAAKELLAAMNR